MAMKILMITSNARAFEFIDERPFLFTVPGGLLSRIDSRAVGATLFPPAELRHLHVESLELHDRRWWNDRISMAFLEI